MNKLVFMLIIFTNVLAFEVKTSFNPSSPVIDEPFQVIFEIKSENGGDPIISFDPMGVEVQGKENLGSSTRTTYINGKLSTSKTTTIGYKLMANRRGSVYIRNIKVELNGEVKKLPTISKIVLAEPARPRNIFALAEVDKTEAFVNESILVRYYLYNKVNVRTTDIVKFPALDKFMKRFHQEKQRPERVRHNGEIYVRRIIYTAQLFAKKPGDYKIDPIVMNVNYTNRQIDPFDSLGFGGGFGRRSSVEVRSKPIEIKIKKLPINDVPSDFTGLVGEHNFNLKINKNKFVVNEPIELKLTVSGEGALELFEKPTILKDSSIEEFEVGGDLQIGQDFKATKVFDYTYLGRNNLSLDREELSFSYFSPSELKFKTVNLKIPQIVIAGGVATNSYQKKNEDNQTNGDVETQDTDSIITNPKFDYFKPLYKSINTYRYNSKTLALIFSLIAVFILLFRFKDIVLDLLSKNHEDDIYSRASKKGVSYAELYEIISQLGSGQDMKSIVENSVDSKPLKNYLLKVIDNVDKAYTSGKSKRIKIDKTMIKEIKNLINKDVEWT